MTKEDEIRWNMELNDIYMELVDSPKKKVEIEGDFSWRGEGERVSYVPISEVNNILEKHKKGGL